MKVFTAIGVAAALTFASADAIAGDTPSAPGARAFFVDLKDGAEVVSPLKVNFGIEGMNIEPAGTDKPNSGHFHLLVDTQLTGAEREFAIPVDEKHLHFGKGQREALINLTAGQHKLQIVMGDAKHELHKPAVESAVITVTVK